MSVLRMFQAACVISLVFVFSHVAVAKDLSTLQASVAYAREEMEKAKAGHEASVLATSQQQRVVEERKQQLDDESKRLDSAQKEIKRAWDRYLETKQKYDKAQSSLNKAWGNQ